MPPIVISRSTGEVQSAPEITQDQRDNLWETIIRAYIKKHPEILREEDSIEHGCT